MVVERLPPPKGDPDAKLQALIVDSWFDNYLGVVSLVRVVNGSVKKGQKIRVLSTGKDHEITMLGVNAPKRVFKDQLECGERSEEHTSELQSLMRISYAVFCLKK